MSVEPSLLSPTYTVTNPLRFVIAGQEYGDTSGGVRALNRLCHWLNVLGHDASIAGVLKVHPDWEVKTWDGIITPDTIAIYADAFTGNPYHARRVVRWCLYYPGLRDGPSTFPSNERVYYFADLFREATFAASANPIYPKRLNVNVFEPDVLYPWLGPKLYDAFWVGRGTDVVAKFSRLIDTSRMFEMWPRYGTRAQFAKAMRRIRNFYSFDPCSAMVPEAALCGAQTFHISDTGVVRHIEPGDPEMLHAFDDVHAFNSVTNDLEQFVNDMRVW